MFRSIHAAAQPSAATTASSISPAKPRRPGLPYDAQYLLDALSTAFTGDSLLIRGCVCADFQQGGATHLIARCRRRFFFGGIWEIQPTTLTESMAGLHADDIQVIDVREPDEFSSGLGHIPGARLLPLAQLARSAEIDPAWQVVTVCRSGTPRPCLSSRAKPDQLSRDVACPVLPATPWPLRCAGPAPRCHRS